MNEALQQTNDPETPKQNEPTPRLYVAKVLVTYEQVELPRSCPGCNAPFIGPVPARQPRYPGEEVELAERNLKEVNLAETSFTGAMICLNEYEPDVSSCTEEAESLWLPYRYACARCGQHVAGSEVTVVDAAG